MNKRKIFIWVLALVGLLCVTLLLTVKKPVSIDNEAKLYQEKYGVPLIPPNPPEIQDEHGCLVLADYRWCELKQKCLRPYEEICEASKTK
jgi:hypothetical protein